MGSNASSRAEDGHGRSLIVFPVCVTVVALTAFSPMFAVLTGRTLSGRASTAKPIGALGQAEPRAQAIPEDRAFGRGMGSLRAASESHPGAVQAADR